MRVKCVPELMKKDGVRALNTNNRHIYNGKEITFDESKKILKKYLTDKGCVDLEKDAVSGIAKIRLNYPQTKNAINGTNQTIPYRNTLSARVYFIKTIKKYTHNKTDIFVRFMALTKVAILGVMNIAQCI